MSVQPILTAQGRVKRSGRVSAAKACDFDLMPVGMPGVVGDNGAAKASLIQAPSGAISPDDGDILIRDVRARGIPMRVIGPRAQSMPDAAANMTRATVPEWVAA